MYIQNLHMPVGEIIPELDRKPAEHMHRNLTLRGITLGIIGMVAGCCADFPETPEQIPLLPGSQRPQKFQHFHVDQHPPGAHGASCGSPSSCAHCSGVSQRPGVVSSIFLASFSA